MEPDTIRAKIVEKLRSEALPKERPRLSRAASPRNTAAVWWIGSGPAGNCAACECPIEDGQLFHGFRRGSGLETRFGCMRSVSVCWMGSARGSGDHGRTSV